MLKNRTNTTNPELRKEKKREKGTFAKEEKRRMGEAAETVVP